MEIRNSHVEKLDNFMNFLPCSMFITIWVLQSTDQRAVTEKPRVFVSHDAGERERSTQIAMINDSNSKFVSNQGNAISRFQKDTSAQHKLWVGIFCFCDQESLHWWGSEAQQAPSAVNRPNA